MKKSFGNRGAYAGSYVPAKLLRPIIDQPIRKKLIGLTTLLLACISLFIYLFFPFQLEKQVGSAIAEKAASITEMSTYILGPALDSSKPDQVEAALDAAIQFEDVVYAYVLSVDGQSLASFARLSEEAPPVFTTRADGSNAEGTVYRVHRTIVWNNQVLGQLFMGFSLEPLTEALRQIRLLIALVSLLVFLLGMAAMYGISRVITHPLGDIVRVTNCISSGDLEQRAPVHAQDEVGQLALSFNGMVDSLQEAYEALRVSESRFRAVIDNVSDVIATFDSRLRFTFASPSATTLLSHTPEELIGRSVLRYIHPEDQRRIMQAVACGRTRPDDAITVEARWRYSEGNWRYLSIRARNLLDVPGVDGVLVTMSDITATKRFEQELVEAKNRAVEMARLKDVFLANMSHEIRTPLTGILGLSQILRMEVEGEQCELVGIIEASGQRLLNTLNSVLDLAQLEANTIKLDMKTVDIAREVREMSQVLEPLAKGKGLTLTVQTQREALYCDIDEGCLQRILNNLVGNAIKFTEQGGIHIQLFVQKEWLHLYVQDTGVGIDEGFQEHMFSEFKQESDGFNRTHEGNGLGLNITKRLVELMGGTIEVESVKGLGSTFKVALPYDGGPIEDLEPVRPSRQAGKGWPGVEIPQKIHHLDAAAHEPRRALSEKSDFRILAVDDNEQAIILFKRWLGKSYDLVTVMSGTEALVCAEAQPFDLVLMDINLGVGSNGIDTMAAIRRMPHLAQTPVIALTAYALPGDAQKFRELGFDGYLSKPFTEDGLLRAVAAFQPEAAAVPAALLERPPRRPQGRSMPG